MVWTTSEFGCWKQILSQHALHHGLLERIKGFVMDLQESNPTWSSSLDVRLYDSAPACFILAVDGHVLLEPYNYGKLGVKPEGMAIPRTLGADMPLIEYVANPVPLYAQDADSRRSPYGLLIDHFEFAFNIAKPVKFSD
jgi:hypothetical protein